MNTVVGSYLRVERRGDHGSLPHRHWLPARGPGKNFNTFPDILHPGRPNKHRVQRAIVQTRLGKSGHVQVRFERVDLPSKGIAPHRDVQRAERNLVISAVTYPTGQHDHPGARSESWHAVSESCGEVCPQAENVEQAADRGRLPTRYDDSADLVEFRGTSHGHGGDPESCQRGEMFPHIAL